MSDQNNPAPLRWRLPVLQLAVCLIALFPARGHLLLGIIEAFPPYVFTATPEPQQPVLVVPSFTPEQERALDRRAKRAEFCLRVPVVLNLPMLIAQLPYVIVSPSKQEWTPNGMLPEIWRALSLPFLGMVLWWWVGRGFEALRAARGGIVQPRLGWIDTILAGFLVVVGAVCGVGFVTTTPDDRADMQFLMVLSGGLLWGILASLLIWTRVKQWRITKREAMSAGSSTSLA